jgi:hypothetical protein
MAPIATPVAATPRTGSAAGERMSASHWTEIATKTATTKATAVETATAETSSMETATAVETTTTETASAASAPAVASCPSCVS